MRSLAPNVPTITLADFYTMLPVFIQKLADERNEKINREMPTLGPTYHNCGYDEGSRFVKVWDTQHGQKFVAYFVEKATGTIFGAKGWKMYNPNHEYGTLATMHEWDWSDFYAKHKEGKTSMVPKALRR